jgi:hypothetical protein
MWLGRDESRVSQKGPPRDADEMYTGAGGESQGKEGRKMERERREESPIPSFTKGPWDVVKLGRWAGVFVFLSALVLAVWETLYFHVFVDSGIPSSGTVIFFAFLSTLLQRGSWGVVIILLAELVERMTDHNEE